MMSSRLTTPSIALRPPEFASAWSPQARKFQAAQPVPHTALPATQSLQYHSSRRIRQSGKRSVQLILFFTKLHLLLHSRQRVRTLVHRHAVHEKRQSCVMEPSSLNVNVNACMCASLFGSMPQRLSKSKLSDLSSDFFSIMAG